MSTRKLRGQKLRAVRDLFLTGWSVVQLARLFRTTKGRVEQAIRLTCCVLALVAGLSLVLSHGGVHGQGITIPNSFVNGTTADADQVNANFAALANDAVNRTGGTMTGAFNTLDVKPTTDNARDLGTSSLQYRDLYLGNSLLLSGATAPAVSASGKGRIYFDSTLNHFLISENGGAYTNLGTWTLLEAVNGNSNAMAATTVRTLAISGLTVKDHLKVFVHWRSGSGDTTTPTLLNTTDTVTLVGLNANTTLTTLFDSYDECTIGPANANASATAIVTTCTTGTKDDTSQTTGTVQIRNATFSTNWTGSWTLGNRHGGVASPGTATWSWAVYKIAGE